MTQQPATTPDTHDAPVGTSSAGSWPLLILAGLAWLGFVAFLVGILVSGSGARPSP